MARVHIAPRRHVDWRTPSGQAWWWAAAGIGALGLLGLISPPSPAGWAAGVCYLVVSAALLSRGFARSGAARFGPGNAATATRSALVGLLVALTVSSFGHPIAVWLFVALAATALVLDAVDGWLARRTGTTSALGARFDMEVDAFALLVLSVFVGPLIGWWVLAIGLMRYAFVAAGWRIPRMRATLPPRYWRKVVTAACGIALTLAASRLLPLPLAAGAVALALALLVESFGRDVVWLIRAHPATATTRRRAARPGRAPGPASVTGSPRR